MKLKIIKNIVLANPEVYLPHWVFTKGDIFDTDNEYLIDRLLQLNGTKILEKENNITMGVVEKEGKAVLNEHANKMFKPATKKIKSKKNNKR